MIQVFPDAAIPVLLAILPSVVFAVLVSRDSNRPEFAPDAQARHPHCLLFTLDVDHDPHALTALRAYADAVQPDNPILAADLYAVIAERT